MSEQNKAVGIDGDHLTISDLAQVARTMRTVEINEKGTENLERSHQRLQGALNVDRSIYGINTGYGIFSERKIQATEIEKLNRNLVISHAVGLGEPLAEEIVRASILVRANTLSKGYSGVRKVIVDTLIELLNKHITPLIPSQGSLGSSGDLCQLSQLALVISKGTIDREEESGQVLIGGKVVSGKEALERSGIKRIILGPKEGLALNNGATFSTAIMALALFDAFYLWKISNLALAMTLEALQGCSYAFQEKINLARGQVGQIDTSRQVREYVNGSTLLDSTGRVQDAYSLRCAPQVHGAMIDAIRYGQKVIEIELNAATDNPLIFDRDEIYSGGNFHGEPIGFVADFMKIAVAELAAISERRTFRLVDVNLNHGLPAMLVDSEEEAGLNSGYMMPQYTAASLVLENQTLANPDSIHSLPTSASQEDHNANSMTAARHARQVVENARKVLAIEMLCAARAIELRLSQVRDSKLGSGSRKAFETIRAAVPPSRGDQYWQPHIKAIEEIITNREFDI